MLQRQNHLFIWSISHSHNQLGPWRPLRKSWCKVQQIKTTLSRLQEIATHVEIFEASLGSIVVTEEANLPVLELWLVVQILLTLSPLQTTVRTVVTDVEN